MMNFAGQDIRRGHFIGQVARTNQGMKYRVGVTLGETDVQKVKDGPMLRHLRVVWAEMGENGVWNLIDANVLPTYVFRIQPETIFETVRRRLDFAFMNGHA